MSNLSYEVELRSKDSSSGSGRKQILKPGSFTGDFEGLTAIMGPSGAGKTSLLNILAGRVTPAKGSTIFLDHRPLQQNSDIQSLSAYVQQDDCMLATQTVRETVEMAALLRLPHHMSKSQKLARAAETLELFGLTKCADTYIGDPSSKVIGVSGGERKRVSIAMICVAQPRILFLDEPTSGLDSFIAFSVVKVLKKLCTMGVTVLTTIHQPSSDIFQLFDSLLLVQSGNVVYHGPASSSVEYFGSIGFQCPKLSNPADYFFMHVLTELEAEAGYNQEARERDLCAAWKARSTGGNAAALVTQAAAGPYQVPKETERSTMREQFGLLLKRSWGEATRNPMRVRAQLVQSIAFAFIISTIWWQLGDNQNSIQDRNGVLFFMSANGMMSSVMGVLSTFGNERASFIRDYENQLYKVGPYLLAKVACEAPFYFFIPLTGATIMYFCVGFQNAASKYLNTAIVMVTLNYAGMSMGLILASLFSDIAVALLVAPLIIMPLMMFSGFFLNADSTPVYYSWIPWISPMKYAFSALAMNEYRGLDLKCLPDEYIG
ncbi:hypothetical protein TrRE_jg4903 [Triparma retinervis]|uniref:ABC transporter domain-containing protein n=1 Tax=Triparma retinervis TaxID=2557542 RepID=A0A9W6ZI08_9STRA|nr:hypothetical protein TrRE_jg4903 [Triparma retinervis]